MHPPASRIPVRIEEPFPGAASTNSKGRPSSSGFHPISPEKTAEGRPDKTGAAAASRDAAEPQSRKTHTAYPTAEACHPCQIGPAPLPSFHPSCRHPILSTLNSQLSTKLKGLVIKNTGSWYLVKTDEGKCVECKIKGNFRLKGIRSTNPVAVGDYVQIILNPEGTALISEIEDRKNYIIRRASNLSKQSHILAANLDQSMLIVTVNYPETSTTFIDRFLASAEAYRVPVKIIFNKIDAYNEEELHYMNSLINLYTTIGYPCFKVSAKNGEGIELIQEELKGRVTLFSGHSGVGKSTLINAILPEQDVKTGEISAYHNKGMHTTTFSEMFPVPGDGYIIDTPGIKGFGTFDMEEEEIGHYFPEIFKFSADCRYGNCTHRHEPGCAVRKAVEEHYISESRYASYLNMLEDKEEGKYRAAY